MRLMYLLVCYTLCALPMNAQQVQYLYGKVIAWPTADNATLHVYRGALTLPESRNKSPVLEEGKAYSLAVDGTMKDENGQALLKIDIE